MRQLGDQSDRLHAVDDLRASMMWRRIVRRSMIGVLFNGRRIDASKG